MATFRASKSQLASALTELNKFTDRIPANLLQPFILNAGAGDQIRVLARRKNSIITAKSSIQNALTPVLERFDNTLRIAQDSEQSAENIDNFYAFWQEHKGNEIENKANSVIAVLNEQLLSTEELEKQIQSSPVDTPDENSTQHDTKSASLTSQRFDIPPPVLENLPHNALAQPHAHAHNVRIPQMVNTSVPEIVLMPNASSNSPEAANIPRSSTVTGANNSPTHQEWYQQPIQLRKLELTPFDGDVSQFHDFWCTFDTAVHSNPNLITSAKYLYLKSLLKGDSALILKGFQSTPENYPIVIDALKRRYDRPNHTRTLLHKQMVDLPPSTYNANTLRNTLCQLQAIIAQLNKLEDNSTATSTINIVRRKFPLQVQQQLAKREYNAGTTWTLADILDCLDRIVAEYEAMQDYNPILQEPEFTVNTSIRTVGESTQRNQSRSPSPLLQFDPSRCCFCNSTNHSSTRCRREMPVHVRRVTARSYNLCWKCLRPGHRGSSCSYPPCNICRRDHHTLLCSKREHRSLTPRRPTSGPYKEERTRSRQSSRTSTNQYPSRESSYNIKSLRQTSPKTQTTSREQPVPNKYQTEHLPCAPHQIPHPHPQPTSA